MIAFLDTIRKWVGPRHVGNLSAKNLSVVNDDYEATVGIPANAIEDDAIGIYGNIAEGKGRQCRALWPKIAIQALCANGAWLDGLAFFHATRKFGKQTIANLVASALAEATFNTAYQTMMSYKGFDGEPLGVVPDLLVVGPKLRSTAFDLLKAQQKVNTSGTHDVATDNPNQGLCEFEVSPLLVGDYDDYWFLMATKGLVKPVIVQKRKEGAMEALDRPTDPNVFFGTADGGETVVPGGVYVYGAHYRGAAAPSLPHLCYGGIL
jgi:phage major head subunit gpT-like protein